MTLSLTVAGAAAYGRDVPSAEVHLLDTGHFALEECDAEVAALVRAFSTCHADNQ